MQSERHTAAKDNIFASMVLDTGTDSPEESDTSIAAENRSVFSQRIGGYLSDRKGSILITLVR
ncbi:MAG: hypothetical protein HN488_09400 [Saprospiraceae bacterium]|nr:hypothetical protein [Saprospiraceae bacterium]